MSEHRHYQFKRGQSTLSATDRAYVDQLQAFSDVVLFPVKGKVEINKEKFLEYFDQKKKDIVTFNSPVTNWCGIQAISGPHISSPIYKLNHELLDLFPDLLPQIKEYLPLKDIHTLHFWEQKREITPHQDGSTAEVLYEFPTSYRCLIVNDSEPAFYVKRLTGENVIPYKPNETYTRPQALDEKIYLNLPQDTNLFGFNNSACLHGSLMPNDRKIIAMIDAELDFPRHYEVLKKSISHYTELVIRKEALQVTVDG